MTNPPVNHAPTLSVLLGAEPLLGPQSGIGRYSWELYRRLRQDDSGVRVILFANGRFVPTAQLDAESPDQSVAPTVAAGCNTGAARRPGREALRRWVHAVPGYVAFRGWTLRWHPDSPYRDFRRYCKNPPPAAVYHEPNYVLRPFAGPAVVTIHDLGWLHFPHTLKPATRRIMERGMPQTLRRAAHFITVSRFVAEELTRHCGIPPDRISVTPLGVDSRFRPFDAVESRVLMDRLDLVHGRYLLAVGTREPRKNLSALVHAYAGLPMPLQERYPLVLAGGQGWGDALGARAARLQRAGRIRLMGYVSEPDLALLYAGAACFIMPSLYEGFGIPILEAMASGVPVVTSNRSAMPEVAGEAALLVDPDDVTSTSDALRLLLEDSSLGQRLVRAGLARASKFSWQHTVDATLAVYRQIS